MSLADISLGDGCLILEDAWKGVRAVFQPSYYTWPQQEKPSATDWVAWCHVLHHGFLSQAMVNDRHLLRLLRDWIDEDAS